MYAYIHVRVSQDTFFENFSRYGYGTLLKLYINRALTFYAWCKIFIYY